MSTSSTNLVNVYYHQDKIGRLACKDHHYYFQYDPVFLEKDICLSPFDLPLHSRTFLQDSSVCEGLYGLFSDNIADGWSRILLDRHLAHCGAKRGPNSLLERLAYIDNTSIGALTFQLEKPVQVVKSRQKHINLDQLSHPIASSMGENLDYHPFLFELCGQASGKRPKILVGVHNNKTKILSSSSQLPSEYTPWIIKFASPHDLEDIGAIEYAYSLMAKEAGIRMPETHLFNAKACAGYFGVQRFDRKDKQRLHVHSLAGLLQSDHQNPHLDYKDILKATLFITKHMEEVEAMYRLAVFNVLAHNRDDHGKNFSLLMNPDGTWVASPAYDLTFSSGQQGLHSTSITGEKKTLTRKHLLELAALFDIKHAHLIIEHTQEILARWEIFAEETGVCKRPRLLVQQGIEKVRLSFNN